MSKNKRPQMPKRRNFVAKNVGKVHRPQTHRDRTKYDRYEDYLKDQLDDYIDGYDDLDEDTKAKFLAKLKGEEYDPDGRANWDEYRYDLAEEAMDSLLNELAEEIRNEVDKEVLNSINDDD